MTCKAYTVMPGEDVKHETKLALKKHGEKLK
jgi:hypothetical protein